MILKPKPWWLRWFTPGDFFIALNPVIYYPGPRPPDSGHPILAHEATHLRQEANRGLCSYLIRYWFWSPFRLAMEAEATAVELHAMRDQGATEDAVAARRLECAAQLSSSSYLWAARTPQQALIVLLQEEVRLQTGQSPGQE